MGAARGMEIQSHGQVSRLRLGRPQAKLAEIEDRLNKLRSPFRTTETFQVEEIIDPRDTRKLLCEFARLAEPLRTAGRPVMRTRP